MNVQEVLNRTDRFASDAGCQITEVDADHAVGDHLVAEAVTVCDHHKIPSVEVRVTNQDGRLICHVTGIGYRKSVALPDYDAHEKD